MLTIEEFPKSIHTFTLRFINDIYEQEYMRLRHSLNKFNQVLKWIIITYSLLLIVAILTMMIISASQETTIRENLILGILLGSVVVWLLELLFSKFKLTQCLRGILAINGTVIGYRLILEAVNLADAAPPGDYAVMPMVAMYGMYLCYNWMIAGCSIISAFSIFFVLEILARNGATSNYPL